MAEPERGSAAHRSAFLSGIQQLPEVELVDLRERGRLWLHGIADPQLRAAIHFNVGSQLRADPRADQADLIAYERSLLNPETARAEEISGRQAALIEKHTAHLSSFIPLFRILPREEQVSVIAFVEAIVDGQHTQREQYAQDNRRRALITYRLDTDPHYLDAVITDIQSMEPIDNKIVHGVVLTAAARKSNETRQEAITALGTMSAAELSEVAQRSGIASDDLGDYLANSSSFDLYNLARIITDQQSRRPPSHYMSPDETPAANTTPKAAPPTPQPKHPPKPGPAG